MGRRNSRIQRKGARTTEVRLQMKQKEEKQRSADEEERKDQEFM